ncbi:MAG: hypothetical protein JST16_18810 [Bdellovibrionales bacterium]|nr:hypothetical protein [Bdellovibrionales bacterium]
MRHRFKLQLCLPLILALSAAAKGRAPASMNGVHGGDVGDGAGPALDEETGTVALIRCEVHEGDQERQVAAIDPEKTIAGDHSKILKFSGNREIKISTLKKYGNYDVYPNITIAGVQSGKVVFYSLFVGSRDEYGMFQWGGETDPKTISGRCDVDKWKAFGG